MKALLAAGALLLLATWAIRALRAREDRVDDATLERLVAAADAESQLEDALGSPEPRKRPDETGSSPRPADTFTKPWGDR